MKYRMFIILMSGVLCLSCSAEMATLEVVVKDELEGPITNAHLCVRTQKKLGFGLGSRTSDYHVSDCCPDQLGVARCSFHCPSGDCVFWVEAEGFYPSVRTPVHYKIVESKFDLHASLAENYKRFEVKMRKIIDPQPMFAIGTGHFFAGEGNVFSRGFDLMIGDWVRPFGKGEMIDFTIEKYSCMSNGVLYVHSVLRVDGKGNGAYVEKIDKSSEFRSCYRVDVRRSMKKEFTFDAVKFPDYTYKMSSPIVSDDEYMILRTRSIYDEKDNLISCNYSKIYGEVKIQGGFSCLTAVFNPKENDANIEFDCLKNLNSFSSGVLLP